MSTFLGDKSVKDAEFQSIMVWMKSLTGEIPAYYIKKADLPMSSGKTTKASESI